MEKLEVLKTALIIGLLMLICCIILFIATLKTNISLGMTLLLLIALVLADKFLENYNKSMLLIKYLDDKTKLKCDSAELIYKGRSILKINDDYDMCLNIDYVKDLN
jgi:hypothetical protein